MIDSSFLYSSSWDSDLFQDYSSVTETFLDFEESTSSFESNEIHLSTCSTPNDASSSSSDYEALSLDDLDSILPISDNFVSHILEENNFLGFNDIDLSSDIGSSTLKHSSSLGIKSAAKYSKHEKLEILPSSKAWSKMSSVEQLETLQVLSEIVTQHMGIREQIEIINIIDPSAVISPDDKEFTLDITHMSDVKLKKIKHLIRKHRFSIHTSKRLRITQSGLSDQTKLSCRKTCSSSNSRTKRKYKKLKDPHNDEETRLKRKLELHGQKEAKSGLFVYEKVIKKLSNPLEEDEDVNILE